MFICFLQRGQRSFVMQYREREKGAGLPAYVAALCIMHYTVCIIYHVCAQLSIQQPFFGSFYWIVPIFPGCSTVVTLLHETFTESTYFFSLSNISPSGKAGLVSSLNFSRYDFIQYNDFTLK